MARIVSAAATSHTFGATAGVEEAVARILDGMGAIGAAVQASRADVLVLASSDHLNNFTLDAQIPLAVGVADEYAPLGDLGLSRAPCRGSRAFGQAFAAWCAERGFDLAPVENVTPDHGVAFPHAWLDPERTAALVPLYINTVMTPAPSCARAYALGVALREFVEHGWPSGQRVAVVGSGGLSHWICMPDSGRVNETWDREVIEYLAAGEGERLAQLTHAEILRNGGNGGLEVATWAFVAGASGSARGRPVYYEPMTTWWTGMGGVLMDVAASGERDAAPQSEFNKET
ncbi:DODA-type extradiol aromatic ring-opening family dioxygenase [Paraburkholderia tropica]|uniref:DODA-type extradiol aromatic ring-opening family dioxygenase n=1 Tax=Paraburkholderia tropica TaxID=92647 RepID=UPI002AB12A94|nr:hypothetical protein [Paraburkholderia tropica]